MLVKLWSVYGPCQVTVKLDSPPVLNVSFLCFNAKSVKNKWECIKSEMTVYRPHVVNFTELKINGLAEVNYYVFNNYILFTDCRHDKRGGRAL